MNNNQSMHNSTNNNKHHFDSTSLHATQNPQVTNCCLCTCCHKPDILRKQCVIFNIQRYNMSNQMVSQALSSRISIPTAKEFICKKCDKSLRFGQMPLDAEVSYNYKHLNKGTLCISCKTETRGKTHIFDWAGYGENILADEIVPSDTLEENIICNKCHNKMLKESVVTCVVCDVSIPRHTYLTTRNTHPFNIGKKSQYLRNTHKGTFVKPVMNSCSLNLSVYVVIEKLINIYVSFM